MTASEQSRFASFLKTAGPDKALPADLCECLAGKLQEVTGLSIYSSSLATSKCILYALGRGGIEKHLVAVASEERQLDALPKSAKAEVPAEIEGVKLHLVTCPVNREAAALIRTALPYTRPQLVGIKAALGCGDRLGIATPGHIRAVRGTGLVGFFAQQSIREMTRTERTPDEVMDDATWGVMQEGYREGFGADADHLKTSEDIDRCLAAGFTMFTIDPGEYVDDSADSASSSELTRKFEALPWEGLESTPADCRGRYVGQTFKLPDLKLDFTDEALVRAAVKYGAAVAHTAKLYRHLLDKAGSGTFELEMSVDETATPTSPAEHFFVARELARLGVEWVSLAPRFVGEFEKGVDYKGDLGEFEECFTQHVAIARELGPYKVSIHSGSDKFSIYPIAARLAGELVHLKTAGTSYLEALRVIAEVKPGLFREILRFAFSRYDEDRASYHVSADPSKVPEPSELSDQQLPGVLDQFDGREMLHVTFGSVLTWKDGHQYRFRNRLLFALRENEERYYQVLRSHLGRHAVPFKTGKSPARG